MNLERKMNRSVITTVVAMTHAADVAWRNGSMMIRHSRCWDFAVANWSLLTTDVDGLRIAREAVYSRTLLQGHELPKMFENG